MKTAIVNLFNRFVGWLRQVLAEEGGQSSMRLVMILWHAAAAAVWLFLCLLERKFVPIDNTILELLAGVTGAKLGQKAMETKASA